MSDSIYARPEPPRILLRPVLFTLALHALLVYVMTSNWASAERTVKVKPVHKVISARLVDVRELQPKAEPEPVSKPAAKPKTAPPRQPAVKRAPAPKPKPKPQVAKKPAPKAEPKPEPKPQPKPEPKPEPRLTAEELAALARSDIGQALAEEDEQHAAASAGQLTASYAALIQQTVMNYWSRPPSARNGMEALLSIQLIPSGDVVSVQVVRSSGSTAFDRSAVNAVNKAGSFPELKQLPRNEFEKTFRRFSLLFRPEDLRY